MSKHLRYCMQRAPNGHPQRVMRELGITYKYATPQSIYDQWWFWNCENVPETLPKFIKVLDLNPMDCIGYGLSKEEAESLSK